MLRHLGTLSKRLVPIIHRTPSVLPRAVSAKGIYINLDNGKSLIDAIGSAAVTSVGQNHPKVVQAVKEQVEKINHVYNMQLSSPPAEELAKRLIATSEGAFEMCAFLCSGTEAMESTMKLAAQYFQEVNQPQRTNFIGRYLSYHGFSFTTLSLGHHPDQRSPYTKLLNSTNFHHVSTAHVARFRESSETEEDYIERLRQELEHKFIELGPDTVIGFIAETVVGAATGAVPAPKGYFKAMKSVCDKYGALFILDEVMCGMGRMGTLHAWESYGDNISPDIQAVGKGLCGGYSPLSAVLISPKLAAVFGGGSLWKQDHTFMGHPLGCAVALAIQDVIKSENLLENVNLQGNYLAHLLREGLQGPNAVAAPFTFDIRGGGLFWGIEFDFANANHVDFKDIPFALRLYDRALKNGLLIMSFTGGANIEGTKGDHSILAPAYNVTKTEIETIAAIFIQSVEETLKEVSAV